MRTQVARSFSLSPQIALFFGILAVSTASIFIRFAQVDVPSLVIAAFRLTIASLVLTPVALLDKNRREIGALSKPALGLALLSGLFLALHFATWITSLEYTSVASSVVLVTTTPLWVALLSPLVLKERLSSTVFIGLALALMGGATVGVSDSCQLSTAGLQCPALGAFVAGRAFTGDLLALFGAFFAAGYMLVGRRLRPEMSIVPYTFVVYGTSAIVLLAFALGSGHSLAGYPALDYLWLVALGLIPQLIGHSIYNWSLGFLPAVYVSIALLGEPVGSTILAYFFLHEVPSLLKLAGGALILIGIYTASRRG